MNTKNGLTIESSFGGSFVLPKSYITEESGLTIRRSTKDERAVCGKRPAYIGICTCTKSNCDCKIGKKCCQEKKTVAANQAKWQKCIDEVRAYNVQVAKDNMMLPADTGSGSGAGTSDTSGGGSADTGSGAGSGAAGAGTKETDAGSDAGSGSGAAGESWMKKNQKMLIFSVAVLVALILVFVFFGKKSAQAAQ